MRNFQSRDREYKITNDHIFITYLSCPNQSNGLDQVISRLEHGIGQSSVCSELIKQRSVSKYFDWSLSSPAIVNILLEHMFCYYRMIKAHTNNKVYDINIPVHHYHHP